MEFQDKVGRDLAKEMVARFNTILGDDPERLGVIKNTKLYQFFAGSYSGTSPWDPKTNHGERTEARNLLLMNILIKEYLSLELLTPEEAASLQSMINSPDKENLVLAESLLEIKYRPEYQKLKRKQK